MSLSVSLFQTFHTNGLLQDVEFCVFKVPPCYSKYQHFIAFIIKDDSVVWLYPLLFVFHQLDIFGLFPLFYIVNNVAMDICVQIFVWNMFSFLLHVHLRVGFPGHMVTPYLTF